MAQLQSVRKHKSERKIISVSVKRQLTIPQKFFEALGFDSEAECILQDDGILIRPLHVMGNDFSEQILADLISQGYEGQELLIKFREFAKGIRPAVELLLEETDEFAKSEDGKIHLSELFSVEV